MAATTDDVMAQLKSMQMDMDKAAQTNSDFMLNRHAPQNVITTVGDAGLKQTALSGMLVTAAMGFAGIIGATVITIIGINILDGLAKAAMA